MRTLTLILALTAATAPAGAQQVAANTGRVYELTEVEVLPRPQNAAEFTAALSQAYPPHLRDAGVGGTVHVAFVLGADGQPAEVRVLSTPDSSFSAPSVQAVSLLRFTPAQVGGQPVAVRVEQPITWRTEAPSQVAEADFTGVGASAPAAADTAGGYEMDEVDELPRILNARDFREVLRRSSPTTLRNPPWDEGQVVVRFRVELDGTTSHVTVLSASHDEFVDPTVVAVQMLRFRPARVGGRPVRTWVQQPILWSTRVAPERPIEATRRGRRGGLSDIVPSGVPLTCDGRPCP